MRRFLLAWVAPPVLLLTVALGPVLLGAETFFLRDVFGAHLELRHAVDAGLAGGDLQVDPYRGGGQALLANPNAVALHPGALLHRGLPFFLAFNLHLALHLLVAPFALHWLARELGLERRAAWVAGVTWGLSGFLVSQLAFYNLVGGVVAAPALAAAAVRTARRRGRGEPAAGASVATGLLWAVVLLAGDPMTALAAGAAALGLALGAPEGRRSAGHAWRAAAPVLLALVAGTLLALPGILPFLALLPGTARAAGYEPATALAGSFDPRQAMEWLLPFAFGRPDQLGPGAFWGHRFHQGSWAFYFTLYPGLAALALVAAAGRSWRGADAAAAAGRRAWVLVLAGLFFALGAFNPAVAGLLSLPGLDAARYPVKLWLWVALGAALLCGVGWTRLAAGRGSARGATAPARAPERGGPRAGAGSPAGPRGDAAPVPGDQTGGKPRADADPGAAGPDARTARRRFAAVLLGLAAVLGLVAAAARFLPAFADLLLAAMPPGAPREVAVLEAARWSGLAGASALAAVVLALPAVPGERSLLARRPGLAGALLVTLHAALQLAFLAPALATEPVAPYLQAPLPLRAVPVESRVVHGAMEGLFGGAEVEGGALPAPEVRWVYRRAFAEAYPFFGPLFGRRYDLNTSPEGLDTAELRRAVAAVRGAPDDATRLRLLEAWGLDRLLLHRDLRGVPEATGDRGAEVGGEAGRANAPGVAPSLEMAGGTGPATAAGGVPGPEAAGGTGPAAAAGGDPSLAVAGGTGPAAAVGGGPGSAVAGGVGPAVAAPGLAGMSAPPRPDPPRELAGSAARGPAAPDAEPPSRPAADRPPSADAVPRGTARLLAELPSVERRVRVYALPGAAPEVYLATGLLHLEPGAPPLAAAAALADPRFRPGRDAVLAGPGTSTLGGSPGTVEVISRGPDHLEAVTRSDAPGVLVWQRSRLPGHRAVVDGGAAAVETVNLYRLGVPVPAGEHRVRIGLDPGPLRLGLAGAALGVLLLIALPFVTRRRT